MENNNQQPQQPNPNLAQTPQYVAQQPVAPIQQQPVIPVQPPAPKKGINMKIALLVFAVLLIGSLAVAGYMVFSTSKKTYNAQVYNQQAVKTQPTPTPTFVPTINPNDTSNQAINSDNQRVDQNLGTVNQDLQTVDQSFNDQQPNLQ